MVILAINR